MHFGILLFEPERRIQIGAHAVELRGPCDQGVRLAGIQHVAHRQGHGVQIILQAQQLQRILAPAVHHVALQLAQTGELHANVRRVSNNDGQGNH